MDPSTHDTPHNLRLQLGARALWAALTMGLACTTAGADRPPAEPSREQAYALALEAQTGRDYPAMLQWLRQAAAQGLVPAQELLGVVLLGGPQLLGPTMDAAPCEALAWFRQAADQGSGTGRLHRDLLQRQAFGARCA